MSTKRRKGFRAIAVFIAFAMAQVSIQLSFAEPNSPATSAALPQQFIARLTTTGGPIIVNGLSAANGASLVTGARIQTPAAVSATVDLGPLGSLTLQPDSDVRLDFDENGKTVKVTAFKGCFVLATKKGTQGQVDTEQQEKAAEKDKAAGGVISGCVGPNGFNQGSSSAAAATGGAGTGGGGLSTGATAGIVVAAIVIPVGTYFAVRGNNNNARNPSPSSL
jgi:hypothetical protein